MKLKKYTIFTLSLLTSLLLLGACGNTNKEEEENVPDGTVTNPQQSETIDESQTTENQENEFGFQIFNLHIDTVENKDSVLVEYNVNQADTDVKYTNVQQTADLQGDAAYALLQPIFLELHLTKEMSDEEVIEKVTSQFGVNVFNNFNLEVEYADGENKTYTANATE